MASGGAAQRAKGTTAVNRMAVVLGLVVFLVLAGTGVGYAYWAATTSVSTTVTAGSFAVTLDGVDELEADYTSTSTGPVVAPLLLTASGAGAVALSLASTSDNAPLAADIRLRTWMQVGGACGAAVPATGVTNSTLGAPALPTDAQTVTAPAALTVCAATDVAGTYAMHAGEAASVTITLTGALSGSTWNARSDGSFRQSLAAASAPTLACTDTSDNTNVVLDWSNPDGAPTSTQYRVFAVASTGGAESPIPGTPSYWSTELWVPSASFASTGDYLVTVRGYPDATLAEPGTVIGQRVVHVVTNQWNSGNAVM